MDKKKLKQALETYTSKLDQELDNFRVFVFGSYARGEDANDLDLIIVSDEFKDMNFTERLIWLSKQRIEEAEKVPMDIIGYTPAEFKEKRQVKAGYLKQMNEEMKQVV